MSPARVAVAGLGNVAMRMHLPALKGIEVATIVGGCDPDQRTRDEAAQHFSIPTFERLEDLLRRTSPDTVIICAPPETHRALALKALAAGAHVICEKPISASVEEADQMLEAAALVGRRIAVNHTFREMPAYRALLDAVRADTSGLVFAQVWQLMNLPPWAERGWRGELLRGALYEGGVHLVDFLLALFGEKPLAVSASMSSSGTREVESDAVALVTLEFSRGRLAQLVQHRVCPGETQYFEVRADTREASYRASYGGRARISAGLLRATRPHLRLEVGRTGMAWIERGHDRSLLARNPANAPMIATRSLLEKTLAAFESGGEPPASGVAGRDAVEVIAACYHSANEARRIELRGPSSALSKLRMAAPLTSRASSG